MGKSSSSFGPALAEARRAQGFATPYAFYHARGGSRGLGLSFVNYLRLERGLGLPKPWRLERIFSALGLEPVMPASRRLLKAYLKDALGSERLLQCLEGAGASDPAPGSWAMAENATRQAISQRMHQLSLEQYKMISRRFENYACHVVMANTKDWLSKSALSRLSGVPAPAVTRALADLKKARLAEIAGDKARSPLAGKYVVPPAPTPALASVWAVLREHRVRWAADRGRLVHSPYLLLRARKGQFSAYLPHLSDVVGLSAIYGDVAPGEDSELYLVEANVYQLGEKA
jgi:hypothetical protein